PPIALLALALLLSPAQADDNRSTPAPSGPEKLTVADVLKSLSLADAKLEYVDEPPGKLQAVECNATLRDTNVKVRIRIDLKYTLALFSDTRTWDTKAIQSASVRQVKLTPLGAVE